MKEYKNYIIVFSIFCACLLTAPYVYPLFDFHVSDAMEHYELDKRDWERQNPSELGYINFGQWQEAQEQHYNNCFNYICNESANLFDPWREPTGTYDKDFGRE